MDDACLPEHDLKRPGDGQVARRVRWLVGIASVATLVIAIVVPQLFTTVDTIRSPAYPAVCCGLVIVVALALGAAWLWRSRVSRAARVAVVLPLTHITLMTAAGIGWTVLSPHLPNARSLVPLLDTVPIAAVMLAVGVAILAAASVVARPRRREVLQVAVTIALVELLLLGLWLPIASDLVLPQVALSRISGAMQVLGSQHRLLALTILPPLAGAILYAAIATRRPRWTTVLRPFLVFDLAIVLSIGVSLRMHASDAALAIYLNLLPWLLAAALVAVSAIVLMYTTGLVAARRRRQLVARGRRQFTGVIAGAHDEIIGCVAIRSWLRGPEVVLQGFEVATTEGTIPVPPGATLASPLPLTTTVLRVGEGVAVLYGGAVVGLSGFECAAGGAPFRDARAPIASSHGVIVGSDDHAGEDGLGGAALAAWRPCVAYLVIFVVAAIPALAALAAI